ALAAALEDRLVCLGKALLLHHRTDVALGCHMHRLGDALRAVAKTLDVDMDFVHWDMEIQGDSDKARHEPLVAADIKVEVCVAEPALALSGQGRWLGVRQAPGLRRDAAPFHPLSSWTPLRSGAQSYVPGWARAEALGFVLHDVEGHVDKKLQSEVMLDARMMHHILEVEAQLRSWEAPCRVFETGLFVRVRSTLDRLGFEPHGRPAEGGAPPARKLAESPPDSAISRAGAGVAAAPDVPSHSLPANCDGVVEQSPFDVEGEEDVPPPLVEGELFFTCDDLEAMAATATRPLGNVKWLWAIASGRVEDSLS
ncbi:unnamed protein product, partial [Prorocentrum cordatum]